MSTFKINKYFFSLFLYCLKLQLFSKRTFLDFFSFFHHKNFLLIWLRVIKYFSLSSFFFSNSKKFLLILLSIFPFFCKIHLKLYFATFFILHLWMEKREISCEWGSWKCYEFISFLSKRHFFSPSSYECILMWYRNELIISPTGLR